jgi:outer membrane receptor for ferrienterochelin and colicin
VTRHSELLINQSTRGATDLVFWSTEPARGSWSFTLLGGVQGQQRHAARDLPAFDYNFVTPGLFAQDEIDLSTKLTLGMSGRIDHHNTYGTFASP